MPSSTPSSQFPKLSRAVVGFVALCGVLGMFAIWFPISRHAQSFETSVQTDVVRRGGEALQLTVSSAIGREWASLNAVANNVDVTRLAETRNFVDAVVGAGGRVSWAAFATTGGTVLAASHREREGTDVSERRWFREGLQGGNVGNVFNPNSYDSDGGLINMSVPVIGEEGDPIGVFVYSLRITWLAAYAQEVADNLDLDFAIVDRNGGIVAERQKLVAAPLSAETLALVPLARPASRVVEDGDGSSSVVSVIPEFTLGDVPSFGWGLVARVPAVTADGAISVLAESVWLILLTMFFGLCLFATLFSYHFIRPIERLAGIARKIAEGDEVYPDEFYSTRESASLSSALSRIQNRLESVPHVRKA